MMDYRKEMLDYLVNKAKSDRSKSLGSLYLLLEDGVGIGDHSTGDFYANLDEALASLVDADDRLNTLSRYYPELRLDNNTNDEPPF